MDHFKDSYLRSERTLSSPQKISKANAPFLIFQSSNSTCLYLELVCNSPIDIGYLTVHAFAIQTNTAYLVALKVLVLSNLFLNFYCIWRMNEVK